MNTLEDLLLLQIANLERKIMSALENLTAAVTALQNQQTADSAVVQQVLTSIQELRNQLTDGPALQAAADAINGVATQMAADAAALTAAINPA